MTKFGETGWDDEGGGGKKFVSSKDLYLNLKDGSNEMRLVTKPYVYLVHKYKKDEKEQGYGKRVYCASVNGDCPLCKMGNKPKKRWYVGVISRDTGTYKVLDISYSVFTAIQKLNKNTQRFGDPTKYDINIEVDRKSTGPNGYYQVQALPKEPLSAADQAIKDSVDLTFLQNKVTPPTAEAVQARLDKLNGTTPDAAPKGTPVVSTADDEDDDSEFPAYDSNA